mmetsp:Transcript_38878/g.100684  ORF Transcript_38878/g.100684 Transcript_38878/m.100684 type:complete len:218 (-) Transcript_38878:237-890(-)
MHISIQGSTDILGISLPKLRTHISMTIVKGSLCSVDCQMCKMVLVSSRCVLPLRAARPCSSELARAHTPMTCDSTDIKLKAPAGAQPPRAPTPNPQASSAARCPRATFMCECPYRRKWQQYRLCAPIGSALLRGNAHSQGPRHRARTSTFKVSSRSVLVAASAASLALSSCNARRRHIAQPRFIQRCDHFAHDAPQACSSSALRVWSSSKSALSTPR